MIRTCRLRQSFFNELSAERGAWCPLPGRVCALLPLVLEQWHALALSGSGSRWLGGHRCGAGTAVKTRNAVIAQQAPQWPSLQ